MLKKIYNKNNSRRDVDDILRLLEDGGILIFPTDTVYAIGCHALKERAVERVCKLKGLDPMKHHLSVLCHDLSSISEYAKVDNTAFKLMKRYLPGPFTFILPSSSKLPKVFRNRKEVGIRIPDNDFIREICRLLDAPLLATSLPYDEDEDIEYLTNPELIDEKFGRLVDCVIDAGIGGIEHSTVVKCIEEVEIVREGKGKMVD